jgi:protein-L-isoaspartate(D-aspartate) O-methyltransferase
VTAIARRQWLIRGAGALAASLLAARVAARDADAERRALLREIESDMRRTAPYTGRARLAPCVAAAMARVQRHRFVPPAVAAHAYENRPLPIGYGQTISQPFIVALMTELLDPQPDHVVLEVGTGSGYQAAVLAECVRKVYTIEIVAALGERARATLAALGYRNVEVRIGDGYLGWPEAAPFDGIVVTAAPDHLPQPLLDQLRPGGRMVIPVGAQAGAQELLLITREADGRTITQRKLPVRFVPLTRERR